MRRVAAAAAAVGVLSLAGASGAQAETIQTVARGLDNPRGVAIGPDGAIYVANAGRGGKRCRGRGENATCLGATGRIVRYAAGRKRTFGKGIASIAGRDGTFAAGLHGVSVAPDGEVFAVTGSGPPDLVRTFPRLARRHFGRLFEVGPGDFTATARIDVVEWNRNVDRVRRDRNSNPYAVLALADRQIVVDAGANAVYEVRGSAVRLLSVMPKNGDAQSVPTSIALGPSGDFYVGELAEGAGAGNARVLRVPAAGGTATVHATGFTTITGLAFGPDGSMFVTEFARNIAENDVTGAVVRVAPDGTRTWLGGERLTLPTGAAVDSTGAVYVSNFSVLPRKTRKKRDFRGARGTLVKITP